MQAVSCPGCGSVLPHVDGPMHAYMTSSPACWDAFCQVLAREYVDPALMDVHRLTVDTWAVQHPGDGSRRAIQSVGLHLARLKLQLVDGISGLDANAAMVRLGKYKASLAAFPPRQSYRRTISDVIGATAPGDHITAVRLWAEATWADWADQHANVVTWMATHSAR